MEGSLDFPPWVDLPDLAAEIILEHLPLPDYIRFASVCWKWRSIQKDHRLRHSPDPPPMGPQPLPWLIPRVLSLGTRFDCYSPLEKRPHRLRFPTTFPGRTLSMASVRGWFLMMELEDYDLNPFDDNPAPPYSERTFLYNPLTGVVISLPMLPIVPAGEHFGSLSSPPYNPDCTVLLLNHGYVFLRRLYDPGDVWTLGVGEIEELIDSVVFCGGKFYCVSDNGVLYIIDGVRSIPTLTRLTMDASALDRGDRDICRLVEFGGELLLVMELWNDDLEGDVEGFQVFRADLSGEKWAKKTDMLADHVLFLDDCCSLSLLASDVGCKKNCIYRTRGYYVWGVFDLDTRNWIHKGIGRRGRFNRYLCSRRVLIRLKELLIQWTCLNTLGRVPVFEARIDNVKGIACSMDMLEYIGKT